MGEKCAPKKNIFSSKSFKKSQELLETFTLKNVAKKVITRVLLNAEKQFVKHKTKKVTKFSFAN